MKIKGITVWEQYVEFFVVLIAACVFVVFTAMQFIGNPNAVKNGPDEYTPSTVDAQLEETATAVNARLAVEAPSPIDFAPHEPVLPEFEQELTASVNPTPQLEQMWASLPVDEGSGGIAKGGKPYIDPAIAGPYQIVAKQSFDSLLPEVVQDKRFPELQARFPSEPYDIAWITVAAKFNVKAVLDQFKTPGPDGELPFPDRWYGGHIDMLDVHLEREELVDGNWTNQTTLKPIPGQLTFRADLTKADVRSQDRDRILGQLATKDVQERLIRPDFLGTVGEWLPPNPDEDQAKVGAKTPLTPEEQEIARQQKVLRGLQARYQRISDALEALGGELEPPSGSGGRQGGGQQGGGQQGGGGAGGVGGPEAGGGRGMGGAKGGPDPANDKRRIALTRTKRSLEKQIEVAKKRLEELGAAADQVDQVEASPDEVVVWAHDMTIEQGKTYRYRLNVEVYNPVFAKKLHLPDEQHERADQIAIESAYSDWTAPMKAEEWLKVFVTQANGPDDQQSQQLGGLGLGEARVEVFRFQRGRWWKESFYVEPGDRIGAERQVRANGRDGDQVTIDFGTNWYLLDVIEDIDADAAARKNGLAAQALLQGVMDPTRVAMHDPAEAARDRVRQRLLEEVELAEIASSVTGTTSN